MSLGGTLLISAVIHPSLRAFFLLFCSGKRKDKPIRMQSSPK